MNSRIRRKQIREAVARFRARRAAAAAAQSEAVPVTPVEVSESMPGRLTESVVETSPVTPAEPAAVAPRLPRYRTVDIGNGETPMPQRVKETPDLAELQRVYLEMFGEPLPSIFETQWVDSESAEATRRYVAMSLADRARLHHETWSTYEARHAEFERRFNPPRSEPTPVPTHSEAARKEQLLDRLTGGLDALAGLTPPKVE